MQVAAVREGSVITIKVEGRVDTNTSPELQKAILNAFQKENNVILDFEAVPYISSAGLRALLIGQKTAQSKNGSMKLLHLQSTVSDVLKLSGFSGILTIES